MPEIFWIAPSMIAIASDALILEVISTVPTELRAAGVFASENHSSADAAESQARTQ